MINQVVLMGRLCAVPELKTTPSGVKVTSFAVAVERNYTNEGGERDADFINVVAWRSTAEFICKYFSKGSMIAIVGTLRTRTYEKDGSTRYVTEVYADTASFTGEKKKEGSTPTNEQPQATSYPAPDTVSMDDIPSDDDDYPF